MYFVGIDVSKYKHDCFIVSSDGEAPFGVFSFENNKQGFEMFLDRLNSLDSSEEKRQECEIYGRVFGQQKIN